MTLARVSPKDGRLPDFWVREKRGKSRRASASLGLEAAGLGGGGCRADVFGEPLWLQVEKREGWEGKRSGKEHGRGWLSFRARLHLLDH